MEWSEDKQTPRGDWGRRIQTGSSDGSFLSPPYAPVEDKMNIALINRKGNEAFRTKISTSRTKNSIAIDP